MVPAKQQEAVNKLMHFGWIPDKGKYYINDNEDGVGIIFRHLENAAIVYPDGSLDRAGDQPHSKHLIKPRKDWYSPTDRKHYERRTARWLDDLDRFVLENEQALLKYINA